MAERREQPARGGRATIVDGTPTARREPRANDRSGMVKTAPNTLTTSFICRSKPWFKSAREWTYGAAMANTTPTTPGKSHPSLWAVALLLASSGFALISVVLFSTGYSPI
jgi:hypothetical protein